MTPSTEPRSRTVRIALCLALSLASFAGCGGTPRAGRAGASIDELRRRAASSPSDPAAQRALAEAELLLDGGDPSAQRAAIDRALALAPDDLGLHFLSALEHDTHGALSAALDEHLYVLGHAAGAAHPLAHELAEVSAAAIADYDDTVPDYVARVSAVLEPALADAGAAETRGLGPAAFLAASSVLVDFAYRRGDMEAVRARTARMGCLTSARVAGPFGPRALAGFDRDLPPDADAQLADRYDLGAGRGERATRSVEARGCVLALGGGPVSGAGSTFVEGELSVPSAGTYVLRLETPNTARITLDGGAPIVIDRRREHRPRATYHVLSLSAGTHRVRLEIATRHPNPVALLSLAAGTDHVNQAVDPAAGLLEHYVAATLAAARGDWIGARELLGSAANGEDAAVPMLVLASAIAVNDPTLGSTLGPDEVRRLSGMAIERDPRAWYAFYSRASLEFSGGRAPEATQLLRRGTAAFPELVLFPTTLIQALRAQGFDELADAALAEASEAHPHACRLVRARLDAAVQRGRSREAGELVERLVACDARTDARYQHLVRQRRWDEAATELARLATLEPGSSRFTVADAELGLARARGDAARAMALLTEIETLQPRSDTVALMRVDRLLAAGDRDGARTHLEATLDREPAAMIALRRLRRSVFGAGELEAYRLDGAEVIRRFEASGHTYDAPRVLVLDYTVTRLFADGSILELTHNILREQSDEAAEEDGQFAPPEDAQLLTLRTINADGTRVEPDAIDGLEHIEMPSVEPGDYVEFEYVRAIPPSDTYEGGAVGSRFYFQNYETPFDWSSLTLVAPADLEIVVDPRGAAPSTETRTEGALRVYQWQVRESLPATPEPGAVSPREIFPSIAWGSRASWAQYVATVSDLLLDRDIRDPLAERLARELAGAGTEAQRLARLYEWVMSDVEESNDLFGQGATMALTRTGSRSRVLRYLAGLAGIETELVMVREFDDDPAPALLPDDETYAQLLLRVGRGAGERWISTAQRGAGCGVLPPLVRGMDGIVLTGADTGAAVRVADSEGETRTVAVEVWIEAAGGARFEVSETFRGADAATWRSQLESVPAAELEDLFDQGYVSRLLPGAHTTRVEILGREEPGSDLELRYEFEVDELGREVRGVRFVPGLFPTLLTPSYARLAARTTGQVIEDDLAIDVVVVIHGPTGATVGTLPEAARIEGPSGASATWEAFALPGGVRVERHVRVPRMRVAAEAYPALASFCRDVDELEGFELRFED